MTSEQQCRVSEHNSLAVCYQDTGMELTVHGPLRGVTGSKTVSLPAVDHHQSVHNVLERFVEQYPQAESQLFDETGELRASVRVLVDGERADADTSCPSTAEVTLIPAAQGG